MPDLGDLREQSLSAASIYWLTLLALTFTCPVVAVHSRITAEGIMLLLFFFLPAVQLAASLLSALLVFLWPAEEWPARWHTNGRIACWSFFGTIIGVLLMCLGILPFFRW